MLHDVENTLHLPVPANLQPVLVAAATPNDRFRRRVSLLPSV